MTGSDLVAVADAPPVPVSSGGDAALSNHEKAAIILASLGPKNSAALLTGMDPQKIKVFARTIRELRNVEASTVETVIDDFMSMLSADEGVAGGADETRKFLAEVLTPEQVNELMEELESSSSAIWKALDEASDETVIEWISGEHPQVAAIALSRLSSAKSARILESFDDEKSRDIVFRMSKAITAPEEVTDRISEIVAREVLPIAHMREESLNPAELIAAVMNHVSSEVRESILGGMANDAPGLESEVRKIMFTYEDIAKRVTPRDVGAIVKGVDEAVLLKAIKFGEERSPETGEFILGNITKRLADRMRDDIKDLPEVRKKDGEAAQNEIVTTITQMRDNGMITLIIEDE